MTFRPNILLMVNSYQPERYLGIMRCAKEHGWQVTIESRYAPPADWRGDGAIVNLLKSSALVRCVHRLRTRGIPVVDLSDAYPELRIPRVTEDNREIGRLAAEHFSARGFTRVAFFAKEWSRLHELRLAGFTDAWTGAKPVRLGLKGLGSLARQREPIGILCFNDYNAQLLEGECLKLGLRIPEDIAILGVDNNAMICENVPVPISSVAVDFEEISYRGAKLLASLIGTAHSPRTGRISRFVPPSGVKVRRSTDILTAEDPVVAQALSLIHENLARPYGAVQIASALGCSRAKIDRLFSAEVGHSVGDEITRQRIERARCLLAETDWPLKTIASETGFCHASYFIKAFRRSTGQTPRAWRKRTA